MSTVSGPTIVTRTPSSSPTWKRAGWSRATKRGRWAWAETQTYSSSPRARRAGTSAAPAGATALGADVGREGGPGRHPPAEDQDVASRRSHDSLDRFWYESKATADTRITPTTMPCQ